MIVKRHLSWIRLLFTLQGSTLQKTLPRILAFTAFSAVVSAVELILGIETYSLTIAPFTIVGLALGIFLGFRNNAAYDRFWEGRKLWGQLVNSGRSFAREVITMTKEGADEERYGKVSSRDVAEERETLVLWMIAYVHALRHHLRRSSPWEDLQRFLSEEDIRSLQPEKNVPAAMLLRMGQRLRMLWQQGRLTDYHFSVLERTLSVVTDVQGGCERILNTPIPFIYTVLLHRTVAFYCLLLPFGLVNTVRWLTPLVELLVCQAFFGLDEVGDELEEPFGTHPNDLPLTALCRTIEINLLQAIERPEVPDFLQPVDCILL